MKSITIMDEIVPLAIGSLATVCIILLIAGLIIYLKLNVRKIHLSRTKGKRPS